MTGTLYIVATPIGNLQDMSARAVSVLSAVDVIAAEDTRHSKPLLQHFAIQTPLVAYHEHNEAIQSQHLIGLLQQGQSVALISDAGTPLISDPGYSLVHQARQHSIKVEPIPGACALIAALSASGLPTDKFYFVGFLPTKAIACEKYLQTLSAIDATLLCYESPRRVLDTLAIMQTVFGSDCHCVMARELTKKFETFYVGSIASVNQQFTEQPEQQKGEFVIMLHPVKTTVNDDVSAEAKRVFRTLRQELPINPAAKLTAELTGEKKNRIYDWAIKQG